MLRRRLPVILLITFGLWAALAVARHTGSGLSGLRGQDFPTIDWTGRPAEVAVDPEISERQMLRSWGYAPPDIFSIRWSGYLFVDRAGVYRMRTTSDDGSQVYVDGRLIVDNGGTHGSVTREGSVPLERGFHAVLLQYSQAGGPYQLEWSWARAEEPFADVPGWLLSPRPRTLSALLLLRIAGWSWVPLTLGWIALAIGLAYTRGYWPRHRDEIHLGPERPGLGPLAGLAFFVVLAVVHTWPLARDPAHLSRNDNADTMLNEWTIAWVAHEAPRHPLQLFDGNMFYPERNTLAFSEALLVQSAMAAPLLWLGASPVLAYNLVLLAGFVLTGWAMSVVMGKWTGDRMAGLAAGAMLAFNAHTLTRLPHLQAQHAEFLPLALLSLDGLLRRPRWSAAIWLSVWMSLEALTSVYLLIFTAVAVSVACLARPEDWLGTRFRAVAPKLLGSAALATLFLIPYLLPYWHLFHAGFARSIDEAAFFSAGAENFLTAPSRFHALNGVAPALFPGVAASALAIAAIASGTAWADARARMCLAFGLLGILLSLGPAVAPGYEFFYSTLPVLRAIRVTSRFGYLGLVALAVLGGYGMAFIRRLISAKAPWRGLGPAASAVLIALVALEPMAAPISYQRFDGISPIYRLPAADAQAVVAELPLPSPDVPFYNAPALLNSTSNWKPLLNGYSGFTPDSYARHYLALRTFPSAGALDALRSAGVTHVFAHLDQFSPGDIERLERSAMLEELGRDGSVVLYRVRH